MAPGPHNASDLFWSFTWLALQGDNPQVLAYVMVSPNFAPKDPAATVLTWPWATHFVPLLLGPEHQWQPRNAEQARYWSHRYPTQALLPMMALVKYVRDQPLEQVKTPILTLYSQDDQVVSAVGAGDSFVGALVLALSHGQPRDKALAFAVAAAAAACITPATRLCRPEDVARLRAEVWLEDLA